MSRKDLIVIGAGGHTTSCIDTIEQDGRFKIKGLVGFAHEIGSQKFGYKVIASDSDLNVLSKEFKYAFISIGQIRSPDQRIRLYNLILELGFIVPTIISPKAYISRHSFVGSGSIIMPGAIIHAGATIGKNCIINSRSLVEHDVHVGDHCHLSTGSILNGGVSIGNGSFIGSGTIIKEGISVGAHSFVGMGMSLLQDLHENSRYLGERT